MEAAAREVADLAERAALTAGWVEGGLLPRAALEHTSTFTP